jgi:hypothetical protein
MAKSTKSGGYGPSSRCVPKQPTPNLPSSKNPKKY